MGARMRLCCGVVAVMAVFAPAATAGDPSPGDLVAYDKATTHMERAFGAVGTCKTCTHAQASAAYRALHAYVIVTKRVAAHVGCASGYPRAAGRKAEAAMLAWSRSLSRADRARTVSAYTRYATGMGVTITTCWQQNGLVP